MRHPRSLSQQVPQVRTFNRCANVWACAGVGRVLYPTTRQGQYLFSPTVTFPSTSLNPNPAHFHICTTQRQRPHSINLPPNFPSKVVTRARLKKGRKRPKLTRLYLPFRCDRHILVASVGSSCLRRAPISVRPVLRRSADLATPTASAT